MRIPPLSIRFPICDQDGNPSRSFIQLWELMRTQLVGITPLSSTDPIVTGNLPANGLQGAWEDVRAQLVNVGPLNTQIPIVKNTLPTVAFQRQWEALRNSPPFSP